MLNDECSLKVWSQRFEAGMHLMRCRYMTQSCRINSEKHTQFPYTCAAPDLLRTRRLITEGMQLPTRLGQPPAVVYVRERTFLDNPRTPAEVKVRFVTTPPPAAMTGLQSGTHA
jgi:hypothetical protein